MRRTLPVLLLAFAVIGCASLAVPRGDDVIEAVDGYLQEHRYNGAVLIAHRGEVVLARGYGVAHAATGRPVTTDTIFPIASITKPFTALAISQLHERGLLDVDDPVSDHIAGFPDGDRITIHHLLTHTSGLPRDLGELIRVPEDATVSAALAAYPGVPLAFEPGSAHEYSNIGYYLLSLIVEEVSGQSYEEYLRTAVLEPAGMVDTGVAVEPLVHPRVATGYRGHADTGEAVAPLHAAWWKGAGGMYSTVEDLYRWEQALTAGQLLGPDAWREMHMTQSPVSSSSLQRYGYGWFIIEPQQVVWHSGDLSGHHTWIFRDLGTELTIVALTNDDAWDARGIDLIVLHERSRFLQDQRIFPAVRYLGMVAGVAGLLSLLVAVAALARGRRRLSRPGPRRLVVRFLIPLAIAVPVLVVASQPVRLLGWSALTVTAPAIAWLSISLLGVVALTMAIAARAFIRPVE